MKTLMVKLKIWHQFHLISAILIDYEPLTKITNIKMKSNNNYKILLCLKLMKLFV